MNPTGGSETKKRPLGHRTEHAVDSYAVKSDTSELSPDVLFCSYIFCNSAETQ